MGGMGTLPVETGRRAAQGTIKGPGSTDFPSARCKGLQGQPPPLPDGETEAQSTVTSCTSTKPLNTMPDLPSGRLAPDLDWLSSVAAPPLSDSVYGTKAHIVL